LTPAGASRLRSSDNLGNQGQIVVAVERITGLFFDQLWQTWEFSTSEFHTESTKTTAIAVFGVNALTPSSMPRLAVDYFVADGVNIDGSFGFAAGRTTCRRRPSPYECWTGIQHDGPWTGITVITRLTSSG
jgi:hypothetical protein